jgi:hypothetical protein
MNITELNAIDEIINLAIEEDLCPEIIASALLFMKTDSTLSPLDAMELAYSEWTK